MDGQTAQVAPLLPKWTRDDFLTETPYKWLYDRRDNKFLLNIMLGKAQDMAKEVKFAGFIKTWQSYVESNSPKQSILGNLQTLFPEQPVQLQCQNYVCDEYGVSYSGRMGEEVQVCSHPIMPTMRVVNLDSGEEKLEISDRKSVV